MGESEYIVSVHSSGGEQDIMGIYDVGSAEASGKLAVPECVALILGTPEELETSEDLVLVTFETDETPDPKLTAVTEEDAVGLAIEFMERNGDIAMDVQPRFARLLGEVAPEFGQAYSEANPSEALQELIDQHKISLGYL